MSMLMILGLFNPVAYGASDLMPIDGRNIIDMADGHYNLTCELSGNSNKEFLPQLKKIVGGNDDSYIYRDFKKAVPLLEAYLSLDFTVRDGEIYNGDSRKFNSEAYSNLKLIGRSNEYEMDKNRNISIIKNKFETSVLYYNLGKASQDRLPVNRTPITVFNDIGYGHSNDKYNERVFVPGTNFEKVNVVTTEYAIADGHKLHPDFENKLVLNVGGSLAESGVIIDPSSLTALVRIPAVTSYIEGGRTGGNGPDDTFPPSVNVVNYKYGLLTCALGKFK